MAPFEALKIARERSLDLVEISPNAVPPVCKIQDYGKFLYQQKKKAQNKVEAAASVKVAWSRHGQRFSARMRTTGHRATRTISII